MIFNLNQLIEHNKTLMNAFVDLKATGWKTYSTAVNAYTFNFFKDQMGEMDKQVLKLAETMKMKK
tara:strand:- start:518 stop:712 length:195 start_codon:yes stop_codon:yes gene_type:complete